ncbi:MAG: Uma2 family endonuclease, partial [Cyanobacteria bacterium J06642_9]
MPLLISIPAPQKTTFVSQAGLEHGTRLGWLLDPQEKSVFCYQPNRLPTLLSGASLLPCLPDVDLQLSAEMIFHWLKRRG